jgi:hypothetical protein
MSIETLRGRENGTQAQENPRCEAVLKTAEVCLIIIPKERYKLELEFEAL